MFRPNIETDSQKNLAVNVLSFNSQEKATLSSQLNQYDVKLDFMDVTSVSDSFTKEVLLLGKSILQKIDTEALKEKIFRNYYVFEIISENEEAEEASLEVEGRVSLPITAEDIQNMTKIAQIKSDYENKLNRLKHELSESEVLTQVGRSLMSILHDMNNYLSAPRMSLSLIKLINDKKYQDPEIASGVKKGLDGILKVQDLVEKRKRDLTEQASGKNYNFFPLSSMVMEALDIMQDSLDEHKITINITVPSKIEVKCERSAFIQVLLNLIKNSLSSIKDLPEKWIKCSLRVDKKNEFLKLYVVDSGKGIEESLRQKMFDLFFTTKKESSGSGFGLNYSREELKRFSMKLSYVDSDRTTFLIEIPFSQARKH